MSDWPVLKRYTGESLNRIALPLGGIGTGTVSLGGRGQLQDWELYDRPAKGFNGQSLALLYAQAEGQEPVCRALEGILPAPYDGAFGSTYAYHGVPRMRSCSFEAAYPFGQVLLSDPAVPLQVRLQAFNPFIPADPERSGIPVAVLRYQLTNPGALPVRATVAFSLCNYIGNNGPAAAAHGNRNAFRDTSQLRGIYMTADDLAATDEFQGTLALATAHPEVTYKLSWGSETWNGQLLHYWDDLLADGQLDAEECIGVAPIGSLAASCLLQPHETRSITFLLSWHFPNRMSWTPASQSESSNCACSSCGCKPAGWVGNYYTTRYQDAWDVAKRTVAQLDVLERDSLAFTNSFLASDLPDEIKEAALFNLSTLRSQTCFRTADGRFYGWEGCGDAQGCCPGSCTHVWNYEQATAFLFGSLASSMREVEFMHATLPEGLMHFRVPLPLDQKPESPLAAADGQMGCIIKMYRDWQLSGDTAALHTMWPKIKAALAFAWLPGGWDADQDGVMEGCQHNTLDVEYYGPNPLMAGWYLGALRAAAQMAQAIGDAEFAVRCTSLAERGSSWVDAHLFNGEYYEQIVQPARDASAILPGLRSSMGAAKLADPDYQVGTGCLIDQLVGQLLARICSLGYLLDADHVRTALRSILAYNGKADLYGHFNHLRTFALNDESALVMVSYPHGNRPHTPVPYFNEVMTGFEYAVAAHLLYEGMVEEGLSVIRHIRARYDGRRRNPFDEAECGHHYARAMCSWAAVLAWSGFHYSAVEGEMSFVQRPGRHFWSTGYAWGTCEVNQHENGWGIALQVLSGQLTLRQLNLGGLSVPLQEERVLSAQDILSISVDEQ